MDWNVMVQYLPQYEKAAWLTLRLGVAGIFWAILVGLVCAVLQYEKVPVLRRIVGAYIQLSRNTPLLVQLFFLYYGLSKIGIKTNAELCGIAGLAFLGGSYMAEAFRSGSEAIEPIQTESALSLGMRRRQTMRCMGQRQHRGHRFCKAELRLHGGHPLSGQPGYHCPRCEQGQYHPAGLDQRRDQEPGRGELLPQGLRGDAGGYLRP